MCICMVYAIICCLIYSLFTINKSWTCVQVVNFLPVLLVLLKLILFALIWVKVEKNLSFEFQIKCCFSTVLARFQILESNLLVMRKWGQVLCWSSSSIKGHSLWCLTNIFLLVEVSSTLLSLIACQSKTCSVTLSQEWKNVDYTWFSNVRSSPASLAHFVWLFMSCLNNYLLKSKGSWLWRKL